MLYALAAILLLGLAYTFFRKWRVERQHPPRGKFVEVEGQRIHAITGGTPSADKPTVVLIHGASGNACDPAEALMAPLVDQGHRVISFDRPGYGWSERKGGGWLDPAGQAGIMSDALRKMGEQGPFTIVGHSLGGAVALAWGLTKPEECAAVVSLSGASHPFPGGVAFYRKIITTPLIGRLLGWTLFIPLADLMFNKAVAGTFRPGDPVDNYAARCAIALHLRPNQMIPDAQDVSRLRNYLAHQSVAYPDFVPPLTVMTGNRDYTVGAKIHSYPLARKVSHAKLIKLENCGHMPHHHRTDEVVKAITEAAA